MAKSMYELAGLDFETSTLNHLKNISRKYREISPALSSFYFSQVQNHVSLNSKTVESSNSAICPFCGICRTGENCRVRIRPRSKNVKSGNIVKKKFKSKLLSKPVLNQLVNKCFVCQKTFNYKMLVPVKNQLNDKTQLEVSTEKNMEKKKKKRKTTKEINAGLIIPTSSTFNEEVKSLKQALKNVKKEEPNVLPTKQNQSQKQKKNDPFVYKTAKRFGNNLEQFLTSLI